MSARVFTGYYAPEVSKLMEAVDTVRAARALGADVPGADALARSAEVALLALADHVRDRGAAIPEDAEPGEVRARALALAERLAESGGSRVFEGLGPVRCGLPAAEVREALAPYLAWLAAHAEREEARDERVSASLLSRVRAVSDVLGAPGEAGEEAEDPPVPDWAEVEAAARAEVARWRGVEAGAWERSVSGRIARLLLRPDTALATSPALYFVASPEGDRPWYVAPAPSIVYY